MGYRTRLGKIPKSAQAKYAGLTLDQVEAMMPSGCSPYYPPEHIELYELGRSVEWRESLAPFYDGFNIVEECEAEFHILDKDGLKAIIESYRKKIHMYYEGLLLLSEADDAVAVKTFFMGRMRDWEGKYSLPYYIDEKETDGAIVKSWQYEYAIFNLVYIYRHFDWGNDYLILSAW